MTVFAQPLAELMPEEVSFILAHLPPEPEEASAEASTQEADSESRRRRHIERDWPEIGAILAAEYGGQTYQAGIVAASKRLKSGKQICLASGPAQGQICDSFSEAMLLATEEQRRRENLGRKGVSNGWDFWNWPGKPAGLAGEAEED